MLALRTSHVSKGVSLDPLALAIKQLPVRLVGAEVLCVWLQPPHIIEVFQELVVVDGPRHVPAHPLRRQRHPCSI